MVHVLLVDDSASFRVRLREGLEKFGMEVSEAEHGQCGLELLRQKKIDFIICDLNMPVMDGFTMLRHIQKQGQFTDIPVIMLTTEGSRMLKEEGRSLGVLAWISKIHTLRYAELVAMAIEKILERKQQKQAS